MAFAKTCEVSLDLPSDSQEWSGLSCSQTSVVQAVLCPVLLTAPVGSLVRLLVIGPEAHSFSRVSLATWLGPDALHSVPDNS